MLIHWDFTDVCLSRKYQACGRGELQYVFFEDIDFRQVCDSLFFISKLTRSGRFFHRCRLSKYGVLTLQVISKMALPKARPGSLSCLSEPSACLRKETQRT